MKNISGEMNSGIGLYPRYPRIYFTPENCYPYQWRTQGERGKPPSPPKEKRKGKREKKKGKGGKKNEKRRKEREKEKREEKKRIT